MNTNSTEEVVSASAVSNEKPVASSEDDEDSTSGKIMYPTTHEVLLVEGVEPNMRYCVERGDVKKRKTHSEIKGTYNYARLVRELSTREDGIAFAEKHGLILKNKLCRRHKKAMLITYSSNKTVGSFSCSKRSCQNRVSRAKGTWFDGRNLELPQIYYLMYCFSQKWSQERVIHEDFTQKETCLSSRTVSEWYTRCREVIVLYQLEHQETMGKIGGPEKIVQIDESKFGTRKYDKGSKVEGHWVLGLIEDGSEDLRLEVCPNISSAEVLVPLITKHVVPGTTIHTNTSKAYECLSQHGYEHKKVDHSNPSNPFVAEDGTHTQRIMAQWRVVKQFFSIENHNNHKNFADVIVEFLWRRNIRKTKRDPFIELIKAVEHVYVIK